VNALKRDAGVPIHPVRGSFTGLVGEKLVRGLRSYNQSAPHLVEGMTRDEVCHRYQGKVLLIARRVSERLSSEASMQVDDLASAGAIGLLEAFERFDPSKDVQFSTFAEYRIRGAMYDALRTDDTFTRRRRQLSRRVEQVNGELTRKLGRDPSAEESAHAMGSSLEEYYRTIDSVRPITRISLDARRDTGEGESLPLIDRLVAGPTPDHETRLTIQRVREELGKAIEGLPEKERHCVIMYYGKGLSLSESAEVYGVTVSRISQILSTARERLKKRLAATVDIHNLNLEVRP
jgi:RNA polymerase sigma factor for flagellar operon FliA